MAVGSDRTKTSDFAVMNIAILANDIGAIANIRFMDAPANVIVSFKEVVVWYDTRFLKDDRFFVCVFPLKVDKIQFVKIFRK